MATKALDRQAASQSKEEMRAITLGSGLALVRVQVTSPRHSPSAPANDGATEIAALLPLPPFWGLAA